MPEQYGWVNTDGTWYGGDDAPPAPGYSRAINDGGVVAVLSALDSEKYDTHEQRRQLRTNAELGGFTHDGQRFDSDRDSILRITNASQAAMQSLMAGLPFETIWTCYDGYQYPVPDAGTMLKIHGALVAHGQACHTYSQALAVQIEAAETLEALQAIDITTGWPV